MYKHIPVGTVVRITRSTLRGFNKIGIVGGHLNYSHNNIILFGNGFRGEFYYFSKELDILSSCDFPYGNYLIEPILSLSKIFNSNIYSPIYCNWCHSQILKIYRIKSKHKEFTIKYCPKCLR